MLLSPGPRSEMALLGGSAARSLRNERRHPRAAYSLNARMPEAILSNFSPI